MLTAVAFIDNQAITITMNGHLGGASHDSTKGMGGSEPGCLEDFGTG